MIDLKQDAATINRFNQLSCGVIARHKEELLSRVGDETQRIILRYYMNVLHELCEQACGSLSAGAHAVTEALSRVVIEQSANLLYVAMDSGGNARALLKSSRVPESWDRIWARSNPSKLIRLRCEKPIFDAHNRQAQSQSLR